MLSEVTKNYIASLDVGPQPLRVEIAKGAEVPKVDKLPEAIIDGSSMIHFPPESTPEIRASVALSLLAAQRVATYDKKVLIPQDWIDKHTDVLRNLNWTVEGGGTVVQEFKTVNARVHQAIIPFLTAAFGGVTWTLISTALTQLQEMDKDSPWITLYDQQSRRFEITEYQFAVVKVEGNQVHLRLASARFNAEYGSWHVLFFMVKKEHSKFELTTGKLSAQADMLFTMNSLLKEKLAKLTDLYIHGIPEEVWKPSKMRAATVAQKIA
jgi:hypothetical protein